MGRSGQTGRGTAQAIVRRYADSAPSGMEEALNGKLARGRWSSDARAIVDGMVEDVYDLGLRYEADGGYPDEAARAAGFLAGSIDAIAILVSQPAGTPSNWKTFFEIEGLEGVRRHYDHQTQRIAPEANRKRPNAAARDEVRRTATEVAARAGQFEQGYVIGMEMTVVALADFDCGKPAVALQL